MPLNFETPTPAATEQSQPTLTVTIPAATGSPTLTGTAEIIPPVAQAPTETTTITPVPSETSLPSTATITAPPTVTLTATATSTSTRPPRTPTAPATLTPEPRPTRTRTAKPAPSSRVLFSAEYLSNPPVLDGVWDEWVGLTGEYPARNVVYGSENWSGTDDLDASFRVAWDDTYLYLAVKVHDDVYSQNASGNSLYLGDSLEILLDTNLARDRNSRELSGDDFQLGISPGNPQVGENPEAYLWFPRGETGPRGKVRIAAVRQQGITRIEAAVPWNLFEIEPQPGDRYGFAVSVSDNDNLNADRQESMVSSASRRVLVDPTTWNELRLK